VKAADQGLLQLIENHRLGEKIVQAGGASLFELGPAALDSGFMKGSGERRRSYEQGAYRPTITCFLWPRKALIDWAGQHPEFDL